MRTFERICQAVWWVLFWTPGWAESWAGRWAWEGSAGQGSGWTEWGSLVEPGPEAGMSQACWGVSSTWASVSWAFGCGQAPVLGWRNPAVINCPFTFSGVIAPTAEGVNIKNHHGRACSCPGVFIILFHFFIFAQFLNPICSFLFRTFLYSPRSRLFLLSCHCYLDMSFLSFLMNIF